MGFQIRHADRRSFAWFNRAPLLCLAGVTLLVVVACGSDDAPESVNANANAGAPPVVADGTLTNDEGWPRVEGLRGDRYCEVLLLRIIDERLNAEVWNSYGLNECPDAEWKALDAAAIKTEREVIAALLNGPRYWLMDAIEKKPSGERQETTFGTLKMFLGATVDLGPIPPNLAPYTDRHVARGAIFEFDEGAEVYELVDPTGRIFVMQSYSRQNDETLTEADLPLLEDRITPPEGWVYRARTLDSTLRVEGPTTVATVIQDDLANTYSLVGAN